jgi:hypothetical protein
MRASVDNETPVEQLNASNEDRRAAVTVGELPTYLLEIAIEPAT